MSTAVCFDKDRLGRWAAERIPSIVSWGEWFQAIGLERNGEIQAAVIYNNYSRFDISMHVAAKPGARWATRDFLKVCFRYPFEQLQVNRVTGFVPSNNERALKFDEHIGFKREGVMRQAIDGADIIVFGMLKSECRYL